MRPLIAVVGALESRPPRGDALWVWARYVRALRAAGAVEGIVMPAEVGPEEARQLLEPFGGLLLTGGADVDPRLYGEEPRPEVYGVDPLRDHFESALIEAAIDLEIPILAICRGAQILNVALGGTLEQHIHDRLPPEAHGTPGGGGAVHEVRLEPGSRTAAAMGTERPQACSCHHHQAIARLGAGLRAVGWSDDGMVEALEHEHGYIVATQWHPEDNALQEPAQMGLFRAFVERAVRP